MDMHMQPSRRDFLKSATAAAVATTTIPALADEKKKKKRLFKLSLAQWSLHRAIRGGKIKNEDFARVTKEEFNISCIDSNTVTAQEFCSKNPFVVIFYCLGSLGVVWITQAAFSIAHNQICCLLYTSPSPRDS